MNEMRDFSEIEERIRKAVSGIEEAVKSGDFERIGQAVSETAEDAVEEVRRQVNRVQENINRGWNREPERDGREASHSASAAPADRRTPRYPRRDRNAGWQEARPARPRAKEYLNKGGKVGGILFAAFGGIGTGVFAILAFSFFIWWLVSSGSPAGGLTWLFLLLTAGSGAMLWYGCRVLNRYRIADRYLKLIGEKMYMEIEDLAARTGRSVRQVRKDARIMLKSGMLPQGHMDPKKTTLVINDEVWEEYLKLQEAQESRKRVEAEQDPASVPDAEEERIERDGQAYMNRLRRLNDEIPGEVISDRLYELDGLLIRTFSMLREHPEKRPQMRKFMDYYLPTTVKLVESYADFERAGVDGENIRTAKAEIEKAMDTINQAFRKLLDDLYRDAAFEAAADAKVLKTVLAQDGFAQDSPFQTAGPSDGSGGNR